MGADGLGVAFVATIVVLLLPLIEWLVDRKGWP